jgi:phosphoribosylformimino-5-aminoimidazole carboxamide ribotide isomerase
VEVIPAIDLRCGRCVRLYQGDYARETVYAEDPVAVALRWRDQGAARLHVVDLDGAATGSPANLGAIEAIAAAGVPVQAGGGVRDFATAEALLDLGVDRVVVGTAAVRSPGLVERLCRDRGSGRVVVAVDARDGRVAVEGWTEGTSVSVEDLVDRMTRLGVRRFLYTDISRDGTLSGPNFEAIRGLVNATPCPIQASGGVSCEEHLLRLATVGVEAAIVGRALYTGDIDLEAALRAVAAHTT